MPDDLRLAPGEALALAQKLIDDGRPFHAHEVLELAWKTAPPAQRGLWKGLAQIAVGLTHARRGNGPGATSLLSRGAAAVAGYEGPLPAGLDPLLAAELASALAARISRSGLDLIGDDELRLALIASA
jgi:predicted metal-dependent hydrolase